MIRFRLGRPADRGVNNAIHCKKSSTAAQRNPEQHEREEKFTSPQTEGLVVRVCVQLWYEFLNCIPIFKCKDKINLKKQQVDATSLEQTGP